MATETLTLSATEYRWSLACRCPRMATLHRRQAPASEITQRQHRMRRRGLLFEDLVADEYAAKYGTEGVLRQREVMWPGGILHPDLYVIEERASIEVKSSTHPGSLLRDAMLQNAGQQHFDPDCDTGGVVLVDPVDLDARYEPVDPADFHEPIGHILEQLAWAEKTDGLPDCTAKSPTGCRYGKFCQYTDLAWEGWAPPLPGRIDDPHVLQLCADLHRAKQRRRQNEAAARLEKPIIDEIQAQLAELDLLAGCEYEVGPLKLKRIHVAAAEIKASTRRAYDRWEVSLDGEAPLPAPDYGEVPF